MQPIIYDVAVSIDGYIAGPDGDVSKFAHDGPVVEDYYARLASYSCAIMGRATYEFGYNFGLEPGANPYPHLETFVFSGSIVLPESCDVEVVSDDPSDFLNRLRQSQTGPIYLCGGGQFAGSLLANGLIDYLRLKRAPIVLGGGTPLFDTSYCPGELLCINTKHFDNGYVFQAFEVQHPR